jgi:hypothetical protein
MHARCSVKSCSQFFLSLYKRPFPLSTHIWTLSLFTCSNHARAILNVKVFLDHDRCSNDASQSSVSHLQTASSLAQCFLHCCRSHFAGSVSHVHDLHNLGSMDNPKRTTAGLLHEASPVHSATAFRGRWHRPLHSSPEILPVLSASGTL